MKILKKIIVIIIMLHNVNIFASSAQVEQIVPKEAVIASDKCLNIKNKCTLINGWYPSPPYQFNKITQNGYEVSGLDIELMNAIAAKVGVEIEYDEVDWKQHQLDLVDGKKDMGFGATYSEERAKFMYFSLPYRFEQNSLFILNDSIEKLKFKNIPEFLAQVRLLNFRFGVVEGFVYCDKEINEFIHNEFNSDIIFKYTNNTQSFNALLRKEIDGFIADHIVGKMMSVNNINNNKIIEIPFNVQTPIHLIFSKKTVSIGLVDHFNEVIKSYTYSDEYRNIVKSYLYRILLPQLMNSKEFYVIGLIGIIAFAISGMIIATKENATLFGTFMFVSLPLISGIVFRDIIVNYNNNKIIFTSFYVYCILIFIIVGFSTIKLLGHSNQYKYLNSSITRILDNTLVICDALGQGIFMVTGVALAILLNIGPIWLCGSFFAFITGSLGWILRDLMRKNNDNIQSKEEINCEITIFFGIIFSIFLEINAFYPSYDTIKYASIAVTIGVFITRLLSYYFQIHNSRFHTGANVTKNI